MISIHIEKQEYWDQVNNQFVYIGPDEPMNLRLEHSLVSVSKWEAKYKKPFASTEKTNDEFLDYFAMMVLGNVDAKPEWFKCCVNSEQLKAIVDYINDPMTATTISRDPNKPNSNNKKLKGKSVTSELVYYWMTALNIPFECQYWHFNRLTTLIEVCSIESDPDKNKKKTKFSSAEMNARRARMEAARAKYKH